MYDTLKSWTLISMIMFIIRYTLSHVTLCDIYLYFLVQLKETCLGIIINIFSISLVLFLSIYPDFPIMHNAMI